MKHIRIQTASTPYREVDLVSGAIWKRLSDMNFDARVRTATGIESVHARANRRVIELQLDGLTQANAEIVRAIHGDRQEVYLESNLGEHSQVYVPLERSHVDMLGKTSSFARATVASYLDDDGLIKEVASGSPRFEAGHIGKGILLERARSNYFFPSHGSSGDTVWSVDTGSPTIAWDGNVASNVDGHGGVVCVQGDSGESVSVNIVFPTLTDMSAFLWVMGQGSITLDIAAGGSGTSGAVTLDMDWQQAIIEGSSSTDMSVTLEITINENNTVLFISGCQLENGKDITSYIPTTVSGVTRNQDQLAYTSQFNYIEGSVAFWMRWPQLVSGGPTSTPWYATSNFYSSINTSGQIYWAITSGSSAAYTPAPLPSAGDMVHLAFAWKDNYCAIIYNGVEGNVETTTSRNGGGFGTAYLYNGSSCPRAVIDDLRIDNRYVEWRTSESGEYEKYDDAANIKLMRITQGRKFRIHSGALKPKGANADKVDGKIKLIESDSDTNQTIEVA